MVSMSGLERALHHLARLSAYLSGLLILSAALVTILDVVMRSVINRPFFGANDIVLYLLTIGVVGFFPLMVDSAHHIKIEVLGSRLGRRGVRLVEGFANLVTLLVLAGFTWQFLLRGNRLASFGDASQILQLPVAPMWWIGAGFMALAVVIQAVMVVTGHSQRVPVGQTLDEYERRR